MATTDLPAVPLPNLACPLCGGPNECAPALCGSFDVECWCSAVTIDREALERARALPEACVCKACALGRE